jgi:hypothetical protein
MMVTTPVPVAASKPAPAAPAAPAPGAPVLKSPTGPAPADPATSPPAAGDAAPADAAAAAKQAMLDKLDATSATEAIAQVDAHLTKVASLSVGGGTPEGANGAKAASALLTDASMLLQHAHVKAMEQLRTMATELHVRLMSSASGLAYMGGQVAVAGQSKEPVKLADIIAGPAQETKATMADVVAAITPKGAPAAPPPEVVSPPAKQPEEPAPPAAPVPTPAAPNGNTGVVAPTAPAKP